MKKYNITVNGNTYEVIVEEVGASNSQVSYTPPITPVSTPKTGSSAPAAATSPSGTKVAAPMPGTILDMKVSVGQAVKKGDVICVLEAMKMENDIPAPCDGVIVSVNVQKGATVGANDTIVAIN